MSPGSAQLKLTFLGTGTSQGIPVIGCDCEVCRSDDPRDRRLRTAALFSKAGRHLAIDVGPDFREQMLRSGIRSLEGILITHEHNDHVVGLDEVRPFNFMSGQSVHVYAEERVARELKVRFAYIFDHNPYPGAPRVELHIIRPGQTLQIGAFEVECLRLMHGDLPILGFRCGDICYCTDVKEVPDDTARRISGTKNLILNALHHREHHSHLNLKQAIRLARELEAGHCWLTHLSHRMGLHARVQPELPEDVTLAYDGLQIESG